MWVKLSQHKAWLSVLAGVSVFLAFPKYGLAPFIFLFPALLNQLARICSGFRSGFAYGFLCSFIIMLGGFYWVTYVLHEFGYLPWPVAGLLYLGFCGFGALNFPLYVGLLSWMDRRLKFAPHRRVLWIGLGLPALYTLVEFFVPKLFPWYAGHCFYNWPLLIQISEFTGSISLTFAIFSIGSVLGAFLFPDRRYPSPPKSWVFFLPTISWALIIGVGLLRLDQIVARRPMQVALIQANIGSLEKLAAKRGYGNKLRHVLATYHYLTERALATQPRPELILWPETAMPVSLNMSNEYTREIRSWVTQWKVPLITGAYATRVEDLFRESNSAYLLEPRGAIIEQQIYHKNILLAFGEYMPLGETLPVLYRWFPQVSNFMRGNTQPPFTLHDGFQLGVTICYEAIVPDFVRKVTQGHHVNGLINLTNDSWFGPTAEPYLHGALSVFRAVEHRVPLLRVTNTGTSFTVDDRGRQSRLTPVYQPDTLVERVEFPVSPKPTWYMKFGNWFVYLCAAIQLWPIVLISRKQHVPLPI
jgi:apolipoprotein N-acyltransferase